MIDWARIAELKSDFGEDGFAEVVAIFCEETGPVVERITGGQSDDPAAELHFVKGSAENMGLVELGAICRQAEAELSAGRVPDISGLPGSYDRGCAALLPPAATVKSGIPTGSCRS